MARNGPPTAGPLGRPSPRPPLRASLRVSIQTAGELNRSHARLGAFSLPFIVGGAARFLDEDAAVAENDDPGFGDGVVECGIGEPGWSLGMKLDMLNWACRVRASAARRPVGRSGGPCGRTSGLDTGLAAIGFLPGWLTRSEGAMASVV